MDSIKNKLLIGITGGIGSGKTIAAKLLEEKGYKVIYSDPVAKELYITNKKIQNKLIEEFGKSILNYQDKINLSKLRETIFSNNENYKKAIGIIHPEAISAIIKEAKKAKENVIIIESALIFESGLDKKLDYIILIYTNKKNRIERVRLRDQTTKKEIEVIMKYQMDEKEKVEKSDFVVVNNKSIVDLRKQVEFIDVVLKSLKKKSPSN